MLRGSQPVDPKVAEKLGLNQDPEPDTAKNKIQTQRIGTMRNDFLNGVEKRKPSLKKRIRWRFRHIKETLQDTRYTARNHKRWHKTLRDLRPWEGFEGLLSVMLTHLQDFKEHEEKYGYAAQECKEQKINLVTKAIELLERMKEPDEYSSRRIDAVKEKYPAYQYLITNSSTGTCFSGDFVAQGAGWAGIEGGKEPREGYFEFVYGRFELMPSPDPAETDRLLNEMRSYQRDWEAAYKQAEADSENDFEQLAYILKENLYSWWD